MSPRAVVGLAVLLAALGARPAAAQQQSLDSLLNQPIRSAARYDQTISEAAASVTIITADDIRRYGYRTLEDVLRRVPDCYYSYDRNYGYLGVRGFSRPSDWNNRILLLVNGHSTNEGVFGSADIDTELTLDPDVIERVEVVQGPGSALYGTGAMFLSINIVTKDGAALDGARLAVGGGSLGTRQVAGSAGGVIGRDLSVAIAGQATYVAGADQFYPEYDSAATNHGVAHDLDWDRNRSVVASAAWRGFTLTGLATTRTKAFPTGVFNVTFNDPRARTLDQTSYVELGYQGTPTATVGFEVRAYAQHYGTHGWYPDTPSTEASAADDALGAEGQLRWDGGPRNRLLAGFALVRHTHASYRYWSPDTLYDQYDDPYTVASAYLQDEWQVTPRLSATLGGRLDRYDQYKTTAVPRAALVYHPWAGSSLKLLYGQAFRDPSADEINYSDPLSGWKRAVGLQPERIVTAELVWQQRLGDAWFASVSGYRYTMRDLIDTYLDPADLMLQYRNVSRVRALGGSVALTAALRGGVTAYASWAVEDAEDPATGVHLTNEPDNIVKAGADVPVTPWALLGAEARYESARTTVYGTRTSPYVWTGLSLLVTPERGGVRGWLRHTELSATVLNAADVVYSLPGGYEHRQAAIRQDGRTVNLRFSVLW